MFELSQESIQVTVRIRPSAISTESVGSSGPVLLKSPHSNKLLIVNNKSYIFDYIAAPDVSQHQLFNIIGQPCIESAINGNPSNPRLQPVCVCLWVDRIRQNLHHDWLSK